MTDRPVTTTDAWKLIGLVFVLVDHYGLFFDPDETWWRLFGRIAAPIFFFFIGFARTRSVPFSWLAFGALLTLTDYLDSESLAETTINILLNFALLRVLLLPFFERHVMGQPWRVAVLVAVCVPLIPYTDTVLEYGTEGWLWAILGLAHRLALERPEDRRRWIRGGIAVATGIAYGLREVHDYAFDGGQAALLGVIVLGLVVLLLRFRRGDLPWQPPEPLAGLFRFCGRHSLEIYAVSLFAMQVLAYGIDTFGEEDDHSP